MSSRSLAQRTLRSLARTLIVVTVLIVGLVSLFAAAALIGTLWQAPAVDVSESQPTDHTIYVLSNGFHTDIALPIESATAAGGLPISEADFPGGFADVEYLVVGWGSRAAYTQVGPLSDLTAAIAFKALAFDKSVMHVLPFYGRPADSNGVFRLRLSDEQYQRLVSFIAKTFAVDGTGQSVVLDGITQGFGDVFYNASPTFSLFYGCNAWTGQALRQASVSIGRWTPIAQSVEWGLQEHSTVIQP